MSVEGLKAAMAIIALDEERNRSRLNFRDPVFEMFAHEHCGFRVIDRPGIFIRHELLNPPRPLPASELAFFASALWLALMLWLLFVLFGSFGN